jgi:hypothetical protein
MPGYIKPPSNQYIYSSSTVDGARIMTSASDYGFRNKIINGDFSIWQRGTSITLPTNGDTMGPDRWRLVNDGSLAGTLSQQSLSSTTSGMPEFQYFLRTNITTNTTSSTFRVIQTRIEDVRTLSNQQVTLSVWAKADTNTRTLRPNIIQRPVGSGEVYQEGSTVTLGTTWQRYTWTFTLGSVLSKTMSAGNYLCIEFSIPLSSTCTIDLAGVQLEAGIFVTPFEQRPQQVELAMCQRYYYRQSASQNQAGYFGLGWCYGTTWLVLANKHPVTMRTSPTFSSSSTPSEFRVFQGNSTFAGTGVYGDQMNPDISTWYVSVASGLTNGYSGAVNANQSYNPWIAFSAEL